MNLMRGIKLRKIADKMSDASGAECKAIWCGDGDVVVSSHTYTVCEDSTEAGMFALRERRVHVTQEDFDMAVAKVRCVYAKSTPHSSSRYAVCVCALLAGDEEGRGEGHFTGAVVEVMRRTISTSFFVQTVDIVQTMWCLMT
jgi:hypothetical protein